MRNLFKRIKQWYQKNHQYANFKFMLFYAAWLPFMLAVMLLSGHTSFDSWVIFALNVCIGLGLFAKDWRIESNMHEYSDIVCDEVKHLFELLESEAKTVKRWQARCISANRRRKIAERKLKKLRKLVADKDAECKALNKRLCDYESALLDAYLGYVGLCGKPCDDNRQRIMEYLRNNGPKLFQIVMTRQMIEGAYENLMFPDVPNTDADNLRCYDGFWSKLQAAENDRES